MSARVTTQAEDRQPALGRIVGHFEDRTVTKLPVLISVREGHALIVVTEYADGRVTLAEVGR